MIILLQHVPLSKDGILHEEVIEDIVDDLLLHLVPKISTELCDVDLQHLLLVQESKRCILQCENSYCS